MQVAKPKVLFILNVHPNESFAIACAQEAKKALEKSGINVGVFKFRPDETIFRAARDKSLPDNNPNGQDFLVKTSEKLDKKVLRIAKSRKATLVYEFHCTPSDSGYWKHYNYKLGQSENRNEDFVIYRRNFEREGPFVRTVEIKAFYEPLPPRVIRNIDQKFSNLDKTYFARQSAESSTKLALGLVRGELGRAIARLVFKELKNVKNKAFWKRLGPIHRQALMVKKKLLIQKRFRGRPR
ncbi:MAG: hypothetical protein WCI04_00655 [archaeon]